MPIKTDTISIHTRGNADIHDITHQIERHVTQSGFKDGLVTIFCPSATSGLTTIEYESGALSDLQRLFDEIIPRTGNMLTTSAGMTAVDTVTFVPLCLAPR